MNLKDGNKMKEAIPFLIETALLTHGVTAISNEELLKCLPPEFPLLVWVDKGKIILGGNADFLSFRDRAAELIRIDESKLEEACAKKLSGALTASGTMAVAAKWGVPLAVTAGMGGIDNPEGGQICSDLTALVSLPVTLIATSPKDMLDIAATIKWLTSRGVKVLGSVRDVCDGYVFVGEKVKLCGKLTSSISISEKMLILNGISPDKRIQDREILAQAVAKGAEAKARGQFFHPAVNAALDEATGGESGRIQLESLVANLYLAASLSK
jgi:pseudouridine-5'-phosphate glycosidase